jgi:hypothetical protein
MPVTLPSRAVFVASTAAVACFACLLTLLKSVLRSECDGAAGGSSLRPVSTACLVAAAVSLLASSSYLLKSRALSWTLAAEICSKWQPVYFALLTVQRLVLRAIVTYAVIVGSERAGTCSEDETAVHVISWAWLCAITTTVLSAMSFDMNAEASPALRRCAYGFFAFVLLLDAIGSLVWGNPLASNASIFIANINVLLNNQITSCITSQAVIALHFLYVSCRSRSGRGWAYASLRFELDELGRSMPALPDMSFVHSDSGRTASAAMPVLASEASAPRAVGPSVLSRLRTRLQWLQQRQVSRCRVFVIPCIAMCDAGGGGGGEVALARPVFDMRWLRPLQRLADAHPRFYSGSAFLFLVVPSLVCSIALEGQGQAKGISTLFLNSCIVIVILSLLCCKRYGLDRVAVKHVALSLRFTIIAAFLAMDVALSTRLVYTSDKHPAVVVAYAILGLSFCLCMLLDCSPHLPSTVQFCISVNAHNVAYCILCLLTMHADFMVELLWFLHCCIFATCFHWPC